VHERTAQLEVANQELEAFSYSVSHDLRGPLRSIDAFSRVLIEDYEDKLDEHGRVSVRRIHAACQRMGQLIDDILNLARVSRSQLRRRPVDLSRMAEAEAEALAKAEPERKIEFTIAPDVVVEGDTGLMQIMIENLFSNAVKFSRPRAVTRIEFGMTMHDGEPTYYVRDNGVGFDLSYAGKLFGAFQRLHTQAEFPGTGIGLATVQRIIHRHGGEIRAESRPDEGATFYFTLPKTEADGAKGGGRGSWP
jgi:light-regulated signal transduction histidine kinase (bacteriophytochrome)